MSKVIYLVRHSVRFDYSNVLDYKTDQSFMLKSEKIILSTKGERRAEALASLEELNNLDAVYTSNCVRTLSTAKYLLEKQNLDVTIDDRFDERRVGVFNSDSVPDWYERQYYDMDYKTVGGESQRDVRKRFGEAFDEILNNKKLKRVAFKQLFFIFYPRWANDNFTHFHRAIMLFPNFYPIESLFLSDCS